MPGWNKPCEVEDFADPAMADAIRRIFPDDCDYGAYRKHWEIAMAVRAAATLLPAARRKVAVGVGAGKEASSFYLTHLFDEVIATDLYRTPAWPLDSPPDMLHHPERYAGGTPFVPGRLRVQHMDGRALEFADAAADFLYSSGSIEHFGTFDDIRRAASEMGRVLRPGGIIAISTELCVRGQAGYLQPDTLLLSMDMLQDLIVRPSGCLPVDELRSTLSAATLAHPVAFAFAARDRVRMHQSGSRRWSQYPHIVIEDGDRAWTSYHLTLRKPQ